MVMRNVAYRVAAKMLSNLALSLVFSESGQFESS